MDRLRSEEAASTTFLKKLEFWMSRLAVAKHETSATPNPCETSSSEVELTGFTAWRAHEGHPPEEKESQQSILSDAKEEITEKL